MENSHVTKLEIDLQALAFNLNYFKSKLSGNTQIMAVVKAFAYGGEATVITKFLEKKVACFAVAYTHEGVALRKAGIKTPILVLHPQIANFETLISNCLEPNIYSKNTLTHFIQSAEKSKQKNYPVHLKFNTGLNRLGFLIDDLSFVKQHINNTNAVQVASVFSHLAASEDQDEKEFTQQQILKFHHLKTSCNFSPTPLFHLCNTSGTLNYPEAHFDMVRLGIGLYGFGNNPKVTAQLKNVFTLTSVISQIHLLKKGETVGYNRAYKASENIKIATIPIGYADGISRHWGNGVGYVTINQQKAPIVGNVCMDMLMVDITTVACNEGDAVVIFNTQQTVNEMAKNTQTISYEILTAISQRVQRVVKK